MHDATVLIVDDDANLCEAIRTKLERANYSTLTAATGQQGLDMLSARTRRPDLVLLDIMLPDMDGSNICRQVRQTSSVPIIMLTACNDEVDRIVGLELGADDYITKPFSPRELVARVKAVLRRAGTQAEVTVDDTVLEAAGISMDVKSREVTVDGDPVALTPTQMRLLQVFVEKPGKVFSIDELLMAVWGSDQYSSHLVQTHVHGLRDRIRKGPSDPERIVTVRSFGYKLAAEHNPVLARVPA